MEINLTAIKKINMWDNSLVAFLLKLGLFEGIDILVIDRLVSECYLENYGTGDIILSEWDESNGNAYIIISGTVDVFIAWEMISSLAEGTLFWEYAVICSEKRSATIRSISPTQCLILKESNILRISDETNRFSEILTQRIIENTEANRWIFWEE